MVIPTINENCDIAYDRPKIPEPMMVFIIVITPKKLLIFFSGSLLKKASMEPEVTLC
jgi:hypothetical protein